MSIDIHVNVKGKDSIILAFEDKSKTLINSALVNRDTVDRLIRTLEAALHEADHIGLGLLKPGQLSN